MKTIVKSNTNVSVWMGSSDLTMSDEWKTYRQALRDIPSQEGFSNSVTWPTKPS